MALNKTDAMTPRQISARRAALARACGHDVLLLSGATQEGTAEALKALWEAIAAARAAKAA